MHTRDEEEGETDHGSSAGEGSESGEWSAAEIGAEIGAALAGFGEGDAQELTVTVATSLAELSVAAASLRSSVASVRRGAARRALALWRRQGAPDAMGTRCVH